MLRLNWLPIRGLGSIASEDFFSERQKECCKSYQLRGGM